MSKKIVLGLIGAIVIVGGIVYLLTREKSNKGDSNNESNLRKTSNEVAIKNTEKKEESSEVDVDTIKTEAAESIKERHEKAEEVIREAVDTIFEDDKERDTKNQKAKEKLFEDIDSI